MNVRELRALLSGYTDDTVVMVDGYEDGYQDPARVSLVLVSEIIGPRYRGSHQLDPGGSKVVVISRYSPPTSDELEDAGDYLHGEESGAAPTP